MPVCCVVIIISACMCHHTHIQVTSIMGMAKHNVCVPNIPSKESTKNNMTHHFFFRLTLLLLFAVEMCIYCLMRDRRDVPMSMFSSGIVVVSDDWPPVLDMHPISKIRNRLYPYSV